MNWKTNFEKGREIILATCSKEKMPNANIVISLGFIDDKILVADCQMNRTIKNIKQNKNICVIGGYYRISGTAEIFSKGKYFDACVKHTEKYAVKNAILVSVNEVFDLDKCKAIL